MADDVIAAGVELTVCPTQGDGCREIKIGNCMVLRLVG